MKIGRPDASLTIFPQRRASVQLRSASMEEEDTLIWRLPCRRALSSQECRSMRCGRYRSTGGRSAEAAFDPDGYQLRLLVAVANLALDSLLRGARILPLRWGFTASASYSWSLGSVPFGSKFSVELRSWRSPQSMMSSDMLNACECEWNFVKGRDFSEASRARVIWLSTLASSTMSRRSIFGLRPLYRCTAGRTRSSRPSMNLMISAEDGR